jgi:hypothetical protein
LIDGATSKGAFKGEWEKSRHDRVRIPSMWRRALGRCRSARSIAGNSQWPGKHWPSLRAPARRMTSARNDSAVSARYASAVTAINSLSELSDAKATPDRWAAYDYLKRALHIVSNAGDPTLVIVANSYLARHAFAFGDGAAERNYRYHVIGGLHRAYTPDDRNPENDVDSAALLANAYNGLALACLRVSGSASLNAAARAADAAVQLSVSAHSRLASSLHAALARPRGSEGQRMLLSAIAGMENQDGPLDIPGFASFFLGIFGEKDGGGPSDGDSLKRLNDLVERWRGRDDYILVEVQCATAREIISRASFHSSGPRSPLRTDATDDAEEILGQALTTADRLGKRLDMCEPLLGLAELYHRMNRAVEAEGMFRSVEKRFSGLEQHRAFNFVSAELYCRMQRAFAAFLSDVGRSREADMKRSSLAVVQGIFPDILNTESPHVPLWFVDRCIEHYSVPQHLP